MSVDVVAIGAHPDDVEMTVGGTIAKLVERGRRVAIVDLTRGETGSRGTPETRAAEASAAAEVLGATQRLNLDMGDAVLANTLENRRQLIEVVRDLKPSIVFGPYWEDLHPDHGAAGAMIRDLMYPVGFRNFPAAGEAHRVREFLFYLSHFTVEPSFIVDLEERHHETKMKAVRCYASQFHQEGEVDQPRTWIGSEGFLGVLTARAMHYGSQIHQRYGEPLLSPRSVPMDDPVAHYAKYFEV